MEMTILFVATVIGCAFVTVYANPAEFRKDDSVSYSGFQVWKATPRTDKQFRFLSKMIEIYGLDVWKEARPINNPIDFLVPPKFQDELKSRLTKAGIQYDVMISDLHTIIPVKSPKSTVRAKNKKIINNFPLVNHNNRLVTLTHSMNWSAYQRMSVIDGYMSYLAKTYPKRVELINIGKSYEGRALNVIRISSNLLSKIKKPAIWIDGGIHAREWISPAVATYIIQQLVEVSVNAYLSQNVDWYILPVMNPDGYEYSHTTSRLWRKNRSKIAGSVCQGVDLNRNFGYKWGGLGTSTNPCIETYKGPKAFSEPESIVVSKFISSKSNTIKLYLTLHNFGQYIIVPYGYDENKFPSDYCELLALANSAAAKFLRYEFKVGNSLDFYPAIAGTSDDWAKSIGIKYSYTVELADTGAYSFLLPARSILSVSQDFFLSLPVFANKVATMG